jgi:hypothetical protein
MPISFPLNPVLNQQHVTGGKTWTWTGTNWAATQTAGVAPNLVSVGTSILPGANVTYDLGSASQRWRDLYLSGNTLDIGGTAIKSSANGVSFTSAANAAVGVGLQVSGVTINTGGNIVTLVAGTSGLQAVSNAGNIVPVGGATVTVSNAIPTGTTEGSLWLDADTGDLRVYFGGDWAGIGFGPQGATGPQGNVGLTGATGSSGIQGNVGPIGATGITGNVGAVGSTGATGAGATGATGVAGTVGSTGATGVQGATGAAGAAATTGKIVAMTIVFGG